MGSGNPFTQYVYMGIDYWAVFGFSIAYKVQNHGKPLRIMEGPEGPQLGDNQSVCPYQ